VRRDRLEPVAIDRLPPQLPVNLDGVGPGPTPGAEGQLKRTPPARWKASAGSHSNSFDLGRREIAPVKALKAATVRTAACDPLGNGHSDASYAAIGISAQRRSSQAELRELHRGGGLTTRRLGGLGECAAAPWGCEGDRDRRRGVVVVWHRDRAGVWCRGRHLTRRRRPGMAIALPAARWSPAATQLQSCDGSGVPTANLSSLHEPRLRRDHHRRRALCAALRRSPR
jgi:hypothetical protein